MKIGVSSRLLGSSDLISAIPMIETLGYQGIELWYEQLAELEDAALDDLAESSLPLYLHAASQDINPISQNPYIAAASTKSIRESIDIAARVGARIVIIHPGRCSSGKDLVSEYKQQHVHVFEDVVEYAQAYGIRVAVENMEQRRKEILVFPQDVLEFLQEFSPGRLGLCLDIAHAATIQAVDEFLQPELLEFVRHVHISDSTTDKTHVPLGSGTSLMSPCLRSFLAEFKGAVVIEGYDPVETTVGLFKMNIYEVRKLGLLEPTR